MMTDIDQINLLCYPRLNVPSESWVKVALLYYDKIATIIPEDIYANEVVSEFSRSALLDNNTLSLLKHGLIHRVSLEENHDQKILTNIFSNFYTLNVKKKNLEMLRNAEFNFKIYSSKFSFKIFQTLQDNGLANLAPHTKESPYMSYFVPEKLGIAMMHLLAQYIATLDGYNVSTDQLEYSFELLEKNNPLVDRENFTNVFLGCHFPVPENMTLHQILEFKDYFGTELKDFRKKISHFEKQILKVSQEHIFDFILEERNNYIEEEKYIIQALKDKGYRKITKMKIATTLKNVAADFASQTPVGTTNSFIEFLKSGEFPFYKNQNNYPALFKYTYLDN